MMALTQPGANVSMALAVTAIRGAMLKHTQPFNMSGHPAISLPLRAAGLPVGLQLVGHFDDTAGLLKAAAECERTLAHG